MQLKVTNLKYELKDDLSVRYGHKLRGFFANRFEDVLFHQHKKDGSLRYQYPLIQYKIVKNNPFIIGLGNGAELIIKNFLEVDELDLAGHKYENPAGRLEVNQEELFINNNYDMPAYKYCFLTPWLGLSQKNYHKYKNKYASQAQSEQSKFFKKILIGNILSFAKGINWWVKEQLIIETKLKEIEVNFKNQNMLGFKGCFYANVYLPEYIGLGKSVSRGFGTITREKIL